MNEDRNSPFRAALFDVDGTLVDSNDLHAAAWDEAFRHFGIALPRDRIRFQIGKGGDNLMPALLPPDLVESRGDEIEQWRSELYKSDYLPRVVPFPGVRPLFERLFADGVRIILASSSNADEVGYYLGLIGCEDLVHATTSKDDVERSKPCPDIFEAALAKAAPVGAENTAVIGDSPWDMKAAAKLGLAAIGFRCGGFADADLVDAGAYMLFDGPAGLLACYESGPFARRTLAAHG
jgi:HAD superfamily hydrolase (TIGR01509 family)